VDGDDDDSNVDTLVLLGDMEDDSIKNKRHKFKIKFYGKRRTFRILREKVLSLSANFLILR
jgi:hypothetical protein